MQTEIKELLHYLAVGSNYKGYRLTVTACMLILQDETLLYNVTGALYPAVAEICGCTAGNIERNIRTVIILAWRHQRPRFEEIAGYSMSTPPTVSQFLDIMVIHLQRIAREKHLLSEYIL